MKITGFKHGVLKAMTMTGPNQEGHLLVTLQTLLTSVQMHDGKPSEHVAESALTSPSLLKEFPSLGTEEHG